MKLLLDQGLPLSAAVSLRINGWDVVHVSEIGLSEASDGELITYARAHGFVCVTLDADFHALLAVSHARAPSVVRIRREGMKGPALAELLRTIWPQIEDEVEAGAVVTVTRHTLRLRLLPILGKH